MKVKVAETAGFCFGVKRAVDKVYQLIEEGTHPIYTLGPIIHNEEVVTDLAAKGVQVIEEKDLASLTEGTVVIRSHGVGKAIYQELKENHLNYVDVTCPFVLKIHRIVEKQSHAGKHVVIFGDPDPHTWRGSDTDARERKTSFAGALAKHDVHLSKCCYCGAGTGRTLASLLSRNARSCLLQTHLERRKDISRQAERSCSNCP